MAAAKSNAFVIWVTAIVVVLVVAVVGVVIWMNGAQRDAEAAPGQAPQSSVVDSETGAIAVGDGPDDVAVYFDFLCPHCQQFELLYGPDLASAVEDGSITLDLHPVAIMDRTSQTQFSTRSANAMFCIAEDSPEAVLPFMQDVFTVTVAGGELTDEELAERASKAGAGDIADCLADGTFEKYVAERSTEIPEDASGNRATPTVVVNGERIDLTGDVNADIFARFAQ